MGVERRPDTRRRRHGRGGCRPGVCGGWRRRTAGDGGGWRTRRAAQGAQRRHTRLGDRGGIRRLVPLAGSPRFDDRPRGAPSRGGYAGRPGRDGGVLGEGGRAAECGSLPSPVGHGRGGRLLVFGSDGRGPAVVSGAGRHRRFCRSGLVGRVQPVGGGGCGFDARSRRFDSGGLDAGGGGRVLVRGFAGRQTGRGAGGRGRPRYRWWAGDDGGRRRCGRVVAVVRAGSVAIVVVLAGRGGGHAGALVRHRLPAIFWRSAGAGGVCRCGSVGPGRGERAQPGGGARPLAVG